MSQMTGISKILCGWAIFATLFVEPAAADLVLEFSDDGGVSFTNMFSVEPDQNVRLGVYLSDSDDNGILPTEGLFGFGLLGTIVGQGEFVSVEHNPTFDFGNNHSTAQQLDLDVAVFNNEPPVAEKVLLGEFEFSLASDSARLVFGDRRPGSGSRNTGWLSGQFRELDELIFGSNAADSFDVFIVVPEPTGVPLFLLITVAVSVRRLKIGK